MAPDGSTNEIARHLLEANEDRLAALAPVLMDRVAEEIGLPAPPLDHKWPADVIEATREFLVCVATDDMERLGGERWDRRAGRAGVGPRWGRGRGTLRLHPRGCAPGPGGGPPSGPARSPAPRPRGRPRAAGRCGRTGHHPSPAHGRRRLHRRACRADHRVSRLPRDGAAAQRPSGRRPLGADLRRRLPARVRMRGRPGRLRALRRKYFGELDRLPRTSARCSSRRSASGCSSGATGRGSPRPSRFTRRP